jgi:hypothetical protein
MKGSCPSSSNICKMGQRGHNPSATLSSNGKTGRFFRMQAHPLGWGGGHSPSLQHFYFQASWANFGLVMAAKLHEPPTTQTRWHDQHANPLDGIQSIVVELISMWTLSQQPRCQNTLGHSIPQKANPFLRKPSPRSFAGSNTLLKYIAVD